eukprot:COSAG02_NODE_9603_length_2165_cov_2.252662_2_plen_116_part_00
MRDDAPVVPLVSACSGVAVVEPTGSVLAMPRTRRLKDGWLEITPDEGGEPYFWHKGRNETTWDRPEGIEPGPKKKREEAQRKGRENGARVRNMAQMRPTIEVKPGNLEWTGAGGL